jgi:succinate-acetate transporter protein
MVHYLILWGIFTSLMFIGTFKLSRALQVVFGTLALLFFLLAVGDVTGSAGIKLIAGIEGIVCGASAIYADIAQVLNKA